MVCFCTMLERLQLAQLAFEVTQSPQSANELSHLAALQIFRETFCKHESTSPQSANELSHLAALRIFRETVCKHVSTQKRKLMEAELAAEAEAEEAAERAAMWQADAEAEAAATAAAAKGWVAFCSPLFATTESRSYKYTSCYRCPFCNPSIASSGPQGIHSDRHLILLRSYTPVYRERYFIADGSSCGGFGTLVVSNDGLDRLLLEIQNITVGRSLRYCMATALQAPADSLNVAVQTCLLQHNVVGAQTSQACPGPCMFAA